MNMKIKCILFVILLCSVQVLNGDSARALDSPELVPSSREGKIESPSASFPPTGFFETHFIHSALITTVAPNGDIYLYGSLYMYFSRDKGYTWTLVSTPADTVEKSALAFSPNFPEDHKMFLGFRSGINPLMASSDGGKTWYDLDVGFPGPVQTIAVSPDFANDQTIYVGTSNFTGLNLHRSKDGGQHWESISLPTSAGISKILFSPAYAFDKAIFFLTYDSEFWYLQEQQLEQIRSSQQEQFISEVYVHDFVISPAYANDATIILSTSIGVLASHDGGQTWDQASTQQPDRLAIAPDYAVSRALFGMFVEPAAIKRSTDSGRSWKTVLTSSNVHVPIFSADYLADHTVYDLTGTGFQAGGNSGTNWQVRSQKLQPLPLQGLDLQIIELSPDFENDGVLFVGPREENIAPLYKSSDAGMTLNALPLPETGKPVFDISANYPTDQTLFVAVGVHLYRSTNGGSNWTRVMPDLIGPPGLLRVSPNYANDHTLFMTCCAGLYRSRDGGVSWQNITGTLPQILPFLEISPGYASDSTIFAGNASVYRSEDGGDTWQITSGPASMIVLSPSYLEDGTLFSALGPSIYRSTNRGDTWQDISQGMFELIEHIYTLAISQKYATDQTVIAATEYSPLLISEDAGEHWYAMRGIPLTGGNDKYGAAIGYRQGKLMPLASISSGLFRYQWPEMMPLYPTRISLLARDDVRGVITSTVLLWTGGESYPGYIASENADWLDVQPDSGILPFYTLFVYDTRVISGSQETTLSVDVYWSAHIVEHYAIPVKFKFLENPIWFPFVKK